MQRRETRERMQHLQVPADDLRHAWAQHLDDDLGSAAQGGGMHLSNRGGSQRVFFERFEYLIG